MDENDGKAIRRTAFKLLFAEGRPVAVAAVARALGHDETAVRDAVEQMEERGVLRRGPDGCVIGAGGLSLVPTRHEVQVDGKRFWTWCAYDAFGILGALGRGGTVTSTSPASGQVLEARFEGAVPTDPVMAVFLASTSGCRSIVDDWCPLNNLFEDLASARRWAAEQEVEGTALGAVETAEIGAARWREMFA